MKILVLHPGALGDIILSLPALRLLRERMPGAQFTLAGNSDFLPAVATGIADEILPLSSIPLHRLYTEDALTRDDELFWKSYDHIVAWTGFGNELFESNLRRLNPGAAIATWRPCDRETRHVSRIFVDTLKPLLHGVSTVPPPDIAVPSRKREEAEVWLRAHGLQSGAVLVAVSPGAGNLQKRWPTERYRAVVTALAADAANHVVVIEGPAEPAIGALVAGPLPKANVTVAACLDLSLLAAILSRCHHFLGNDSGISHLAAGVGVGSVVLFGPTSPELWAPQGLNVEVIRNTSLEDIATGTVLGAIAR